MLAPALLLAQAEAGALMAADGGRVDGDALRRGGAGAAGGVGDGDACSCRSRWRCRSSAFAPPIGEPLSSH